MKRISIIAVLLLFMGSGNAQSIQNLGVVTVNMEDIIPIITFGDLVIDLTVHIGMAALKEVIEENGYGTIELEEYSADDLFRTYIVNSLKDDSYSRIALNMHAEPEALKDYATEYELDKVVVIINPKVGTATFRTNEEYNKEGWVGYWNASIAAASAIVFEIAADEKILSVSPKVVRGFDFCTWVTITQRPRITSGGGNFWQRLASELVEKSVDATIKEATKPSKTPEKLKENAIYNAVKEACKYLK